jgi:hypothetical protein
MQRHVREVGMGNLRGPACTHGYTVYNGNHPNGKACEDVGVVVPDDAMEGKPLTWLAYGLAEGTLGEVVRRSLIRATHAAEDEQLEAVFDGLMAYLSDYESGVRAVANQNTAAKLNADQGPRLGLATTRQMMEELRARGSTHRFASTAADAPALGAYLEMHMNVCLAKLPEDMLNYRTVDS